MDARLATVGRDVSVTALATGSWDSVAKLEAMLTRLEREEGLKLVWYRTAAKQAQSNLLPYIVEVIAADKPGILFQLADFFDRQGITIENLQSTRYRAMQTGAEMFSAQVTIGVPANMHIAALRRFPRVLRPPEPGRDHGPDEVLNEFLIFRASLTGAWRFMQLS